MVVFSPANRLTFDKVGQDDGDLRGGPFTAWYDPVSGNLNERVAAHLPGPPGWRILKSKFRSLHSILFTILKTSFPFNSMFFF
jgi:hypothetical protein